MIKDSIDGFQVKIQHDFLKSGSVYYISVCSNGWQWSSIPVDNLVDLEKVKLEIEEYLRVRNDT
jgi:hypothetical protein